MERLFRNVRYAARLLMRDRLFTLTAIASLAVGIGANTTIFTAANALLLAPTTGLSHPERLVDIGASRHGAGFDTVSYPTYVDLSRRTTLLDGMYAVAGEPKPMSLALPDGALRIYGQTVSASFFDVLGVTPAAGAFFRTREEQLGVPLRKVVLSESFWRRQFGADPHIAGRALTLNGDTFVVAGVAPRGFQGTTVLAPDAWVPLTSYAKAMPSESLMNGRGSVWLVLGGRLKPGVTIAQARAELNGIHAGLAREFPDAYGDMAIVMAPTSRLPGQAGEAVIPLMSVLMAIVGVVLLIACVNLAGLLLARAASRTREIAVRLALGAGRGDLVGQLLTESLLLFLAGAGLGLLLAQGMTRALWSLLPLLPLPVNVNFAMDGRVFAFNVVVALVAGVLTGLAPALQSSRPDLLNTLKAETSSPVRQRLRHVFVAAQVGLCLLLIVVAGLFLRALGAAMTIDPGFRVNGIDVVSVDLSLGNYTEAQAPAATEALRQRLAAIAGVDRVGVAAVVPLEGTGLGLGPLRKPGTTARTEWIEADWNVVTPEFLPALDLPMVEGRNFTAFDRAGAPLVAVVNERFAKATWPGQDPIGKTIESGDFKKDGRATDLRTYTIVGVARDAAYRWLGDRPRNFFYVPMGQEPWRRLNFLLRRSDRLDGSVSLVPQVRAAIRAFDPNLPVVRTLALRDFADLGLLPQRIAGSLAGSLGVVALLLAAIGIYGVTAYAVARRTREIGIRMALGADRRAVARLILGQGLRLTLAGGAAGVVLAAGAALGLSSLGLLFGVRPIDPVAFGGTMAALVMVTLAAGYAPARRAMAIEPAVALRSE